ncbi:MAG: ChaB family protein [Pseudomonadota bacterium]
MASRKMSEPPDPKGSLPRHVLEIYLAAFNHAWNACAGDGDRRGHLSRAEIAHKAAWMAIRQQYEQQPGGSARSGAED